MINVVILAGGIGNRLAPVSTPEHPKQFLDLLGTGKTLIQGTVDRFKGLSSYVPDITIKQWAVCPKEYFHFFKEQGLDTNLIEEPEGKNTGPAIALATLKILEDNGGTTIFVPADAWIEDPDMFCRDISKAISLARDSKEIVCLGIKPTYPSTQYGYIEYDRSDKHKILKFVEKPEESGAREYISRETFLWNAGIFVCDLRELRAKIAYNASNILFNIVDHDYSKCPKISFDYAVMEKALGRVIPVDWNWSDLGSFEAIEEIKKKIGK